MATDRNTGSNKLTRIAGGVIGLAILAYGLYQLFGPVSLPACDAKEARGVLGQIAKGNGAAVPTFAGIAQDSYDEQAEVRTCTAIVTYGSGDQEKLSYRISWQNKDERQFIVNGLTVPRCDRSEVQAQLEEVIKRYEASQQPARTLASAGAIDDEGLDAAEAIRNCTAVATFEGGGEQKVGYTVQWNDAEKTEFALEAQYLP